MGSGNGTTGKENEVQVTKTFEIRIHVKNGSTTLDKKINGKVAINYVKRIVKKEFNRVAKKSSKKKVKKGFEISNKKSPGSSMRVFDVYIIRQNVKKALDIAKNNHKVDLEKNTVKNHFDNKAGFGTNPETVSDTVAFALFIRDFEFKVMMKPKQKKKNMKNLAEHIIHELGHTMGAEHKDGGVMSSKDKGNRKFKSVSVAKINKTLEDLV
jgi:predicted Zn-dependent protease